MTKDKQVPTKKYPPDFTLTNITKGMIRTSSVDFLFHLLMAILLITGLIIDLLGPWLGGSWVLESTACGGTAKMGPAGASRPVCTSTS